MNHTDALDEEILRVLQAGPRRTVEIARAIGRSRSLVRLRLQILHATGAVFRGGIFTYFWSLPEDAEACVKDAGSQVHIGGPRHTEEQRLYREQTRARMDRDIIQRLQQGSCGIRDLAAACGFSVSATHKRAMLLLAQGEIARTGPRTGPMAWHAAHKETP